MLPLSDGLRARRFPVVNIALIVANFAVWLLYELPHLDSAVYHASFYPCAVEGACRAPEPWGVSWITSMFLHGSWATCCSWPRSAGGRSGARTRSVRLRDLYFRRTWCYGPLPVLARPGGIRLPMRPAPRPAGPGPG